MQAYLNTATKAARRAGQIINRATLELSHTHTAARGASRITQQITEGVLEAISGIIESAYPDHRVFSTENAPSSYANGIYWLIDPLNGERNLLHALPYYAVVIATIENDVPLNALIYNPATNELFSATKGGGAFMDNRRIRVSTRAHMEDALLALSDAPISERMSSLLRKQAGSIRQTGCSTIDIAYAAAGRIDAVYDKDSSITNNIAGSLLILEAGGLFSDETGNDHLLSAKEIVCGNPKIFAQLLNLIHQKR